MPQKDGAGSYFVDWVLALLDSNGKLKEFVAVEVQTIDTTGNYRNGREALLTPERTNPSTSAGLNWENVNKRILPQLIYKGQVLQREALCRKGLFFVCPHPVYTRIMARLGGASGLIRYALQPASITFLAYQHDLSNGIIDGTTVPLKANPAHSTTVYKVQEAFNNVTLPDENVYRTAIEAALG
ncbi:Restriction endonuclease NotI [Pseudogemmobacter humi]|uniref:Restriction endonuclease NotI n=1 Tax=Pseudogemmobacter humi TaxID=2483812 RepID=A0A3P5WCF1_9RHOB|nr:Restriction endonuclease NotI [Pseudogemmobacter humi]